MSLYRDKMKNQPETVRTFIAIEIPDAIQQKIAAIITPLSVLPDKITWVKPQNLHLSLRFLGEVGIKRLEKIKSAIKQAAKTCQPFQLDFTNVGVFPDTKRPRVIWLGIGDATGQSGKLHHELQEGLEICGFTPEKRAFKPHLTLGRIRKLKDSKQLIAKLQGLSIPKLAPLQVTHLSLMQSQLRPQGPIYTELDRANLGFSYLKLI